MFDSPFCIQLVFSCQSWVILCDLSGYTARHPHREPFVVTTHGNASILCLLAAFVYYNQILGRLYAI